MSQACVSPDDTPQGQNGCILGFVQKKHALLKCGDTVNLKLKLLQTVLVPTVHYGCEVWGMHSQRFSSANSARTQLQHLYELYLRRICRPSPRVQKFLAFKLGCHGLPVAMGRRSGISRSARLCPHCHDGNVGDELHMVFECSFLQPLRVQYANNASIFQSGRLWGHFELCFILLDTA